MHRMSSFAAGLLLAVSSLSLSTASGQTILTPNDAPPPSGGQKAIDPPTDLAFDAAPNAPMTGVSLAYDPVVETTVVPAATAAPDVTAQFVAPQTAQSVAYVPVVEVTVASVNTDTVIANAEFTAPQTAKSLAYEPIVETSVVSAGPAATTASVEFLAPTTGLSIAYEPIVETTIVPGGASTTTARDDVVMPLTAKSIAYEPVVETSVMSTATPETTANAEPVAPLTGQSAAYIPMVEISVASVTPDSVTTQVSVRVAVPDPVTLTASPATDTVSTTDVTGALETQPAASVAASKPADIKEAPAKTTSAPSGVTGALEPQRPTAKFAVLESATSPVLTTRSRLLRASTARLLLAASPVTLVSVQAAEPVSKTVELTDGNTMANFDQAGNANWRIAERTVAADRGAGFLVTKQSYDNFRIRAEFWADEDANSGIFIRCDNPQRPSAQSCYEINIFDHNPNRNAVTGSIVGVRGATNVQETALKWNVMEVEAKGSQINVTVNGVRTASAQDTKHARGRIGLQYNGGVVRWHKVEITPLSDDDIAADATPFYVDCQAGFAVQFPGQPAMRDIRYMTNYGTDVPAKQYYVERDGKLFSETVADFSKGPRADERIVTQALAELSLKGEVRFRGYGDYDPGMPGGQLNIFQSDGKQTRASVYMADHRLYVTESTAIPGDTDALLFEQTITLVDRAGANMDRVNAINDPGPPYDCR